MISVIIPIYNEEKILSESASRFSALSRRAELVFVDGGSCDGSVKIAGIYGKVVQSEKGRAVQMNTGAAAASSDILLFLHADSFVSADTVAAIEEKMNSKGFIGGCLTQRLSGNGVIYRLIESLGNVRARLTGVFYGDQGIFVRKNAFSRMRGFPEVALMEDVLFTKRLRKLGRTTILPEEISVSVRRWERKGAIRTIFLYSLLNILFWLKVPLDRIKLLYDDLR